jgi:hypothetical protein
VRIGVLTDLSGVYSDVSGKGTVVATQDGHRRLRRQGKAQLQG